MKLGHSILECFLSNNHRRQRSTAIVKLEHSATRRELAEIERDLLRSDTLRKTWVREWMNDGSGDLYIYYKFIDILTLLTSWGLSLLSSEISNSEVSFLWFFFLEVIVFFFLLSNLSKNLIPLQKQHPRSVGNRPKKRISMPYSIILGLGWASSRCSSCSLIPFPLGSPLEAGQLIWFGTLFHVLNAPEVYRFDLVLAKPIRSLRIEESMSTIPSLYEILAFLFWSGGAVEKEFRKPSM